MHSTTYNIGSLCRTSRLTYASSLVIRLAATARFRIVSKDDTTHIIQISILRLWIWDDMETFSSIDYAKGAIRNLYAQIDGANYNIRRKKKVTYINRTENR